MGETITESGRQTDELTKFVMEFVRDSSLSPSELTASFDGIDALHFLARLFADQLLLDELKSGDGTVEGVTVAQVEPWRLTFQVFETFRLYSSEVRVVTAHYGSPIETIFQLVGEGLPAAILVEILRRLVERIQREYERFARGGGLDDILGNIRDLELRHQVRESFADDDEFVFERHNHAIPVAKMLLDSLGVEAPGAVLVERTRRAVGVSFQGGRVELYREGTTETGIQRW